MHYHIVEAFKCQSVSRFNKERESLQAFVYPSGVWIPEVDHFLSHVSKCLDIQCDFWEGTFFTLFSELTLLVLVGDWIEI